MKEPGQADYEADLLKRPAYHTGELRKRWHELDDYARMTWAHGSQPTREKLENPPCVSREGYK